MLNINEKILCNNCFTEQKADNTICNACGYNDSVIAENTGTLPLSTMLLDRYIIGKVLGRGGFGITYLAYDVSSREIVAIKEYFPISLAYRTPGTADVSAFSGEKFEYYKTGAEKFYDEAKTVSRFNGNPNIIGVSKFFYENNTAYYVMEYVDGVDLKKYISDNGGKLPYARVIEITKSLLSALFVVHSLDILHRDISPENIYITKDNEVKLLDFGAARQVLREESGSLSVVLKMGYAPVEQFYKKGNQGAWSDIYALGGTVYYMLTGEVPEDSLKRVSEDELKMPSQLGVYVPAEFEKILKKMLEIKYENRFQNVIEIKDAINNMENRIGKKTIKTQSGFINKNKFKIAIAVGGVLVIVAGVKMLSKTNTPATNGETMQSSSTLPNETVDNNDHKETETESVRDISVAYKTTLFTANGTYTGRWENNALNGAGEYIVTASESDIFSEGDILSGTFANVLLIGGGQIVKTDGRVFSGSFQNGLLNGQGTITWEMGDEYKGNFVDGIASGQGTITYSNKDSYTGDWANGMRNGFGTYTYANGNIYIGEFKYSKSNGLGRLVDKDGLVISEGTWLDGIFQNKDSEVMPTPTPEPTPEPEPDPTIEPTYKIEDFEIADHVLKKYKGNDTYVVIPDSVTIIGSYAFSDTGLTSITIPDSVKRIESRAFRSCENLTYVKLSSSLTAIRQATFYNCAKLSTITIPDGVTLIEDSAFLRCSNLSFVKLPNSLTFIGFDAFNDCTSLTEITIPTSVNKIGDSNYPRRVFSENTTIVCATGSYAEQYAKENGLNVIIK